jgi:hypothetical protein
MTTTTLHPLAADYLDRLERAARRLPRSERQDLVEEISAHLSEATNPDMSDAEALTVLDRLGDPEEIVEAQRPDEPPRREGLRLQEWAAILLLLLGGFLAFVGWVAGAILLWTSRAWNTRDKLIGTLVVPGGLATALTIALTSATVKHCTSLNGGPQQCTGGGSSSPLHNIVFGALFIFCVIGPIFTAVYLARRAR